MVEQSGSVGDGTIGRWCINSDSTAFTFADCLAGPPDSELAALRSHPLTKEFVEAGEARCRCAAQVSFWAWSGKR